MLDPAEILRLCYALRAAGDARALPALAAQVAADLTAVRGIVSPAAGATDVVGRHVQVIDGKETIFDIRGDGQQVKKT